MNINPAEILGIIATVFVVSSYLWSNVRTIRIMNNIGSVFFIIYGAILGAHSVWITNSICLVINLYKLYEARKKSE